VRYVPSNVPATNDQAQLRRWLREEFARIGSSMAEIYAGGIGGGAVDLSEAVQVGYGNQANLISQVIGTLTGTYQAVTSMINGTITPKYATINSGSALSFQKEGMWLVLSSLSCDFDVHATLARSVWHRLQNRTTLAVKNEVRTAVPAGDNSTYFTVASLFEITPAELGHVIGFDVAAQNVAQQFTNFRVISCQENAIHVSEVLP